MKRFDIDWNGDVNFTGDGVLCFYSDHIEKLKEKDDQINFLKDQIKIINEIDETIEASLRRYCDKNDMKLVDFNS